MLAPLLTFGREAVTLGLWLIIRNLAPPIYSIAEGILTKAVSAAITMAKRFNEVVS